MDPVSGGLCQGIRNTLPEWNRAGHETVIASMDTSDAAFLQNEDLTVVCLGPSKSSWGYSSLLYPWLLQNLREFDAVIVEGLWQYHSYAVNKAIRKLRKQSSDMKLPEVYIMPHGMLDPYFQKAAERKIKAIRNFVYWHLIEKHNVAGADALLFTCMEELLLARTTFSGYKPKKEINVGFGILPPPVYVKEMSDAFLEKCALTAGEPYLLFLSRIHPKKGADTLLKVYLEEFNKAGKGNSAFPKLVVAGPGMESDYGVSLRKFSEEHGLQSAVLFPGMLSGNAKWGAFYGCSVYILPSHQENFGISVVEALACGKPVIISKQVNIWREIDEAGAGIVDKDDEEGLRVSINQWNIMTADDKKEMGKKAIEAYLRNFDVRQTTINMIKAIDQDHAQ